MAVASPPERATDNAVSRGAVFLGVFAAGAGQPSGASRIVTRNIKDYRRSPIPAISPQEALSTMIRPA